MTKLPRNGQTLKASVFVSHEAVDSFLKMASQVLADSLLEKTGTSIIARITVRESNRIIYGDFTTKAGGYEFDLTARYNEDMQRWELLY